MPALPLFCMGAERGAPVAAGLAKAICAGELRHECGAVRGLQLSATTEPEVLVRAQACQVNRLVVAHSIRSQSLCVSFDALSSRLLEHVEASSRAHDTVQLGAAYALLERLCQQYVQAALQALQGQAVPRWHHQLLLDWCKAQPPPPEPPVTREEVLQAHPDLWPEVSSPTAHRTTRLIRFECE